MKDTLHPLLVRQLRRDGIDPAVAGEPWASLLGRVSRAYHEADQDRYLMERAQAISSQELSDQAQVLRVKEGRLRSLLSLSSDWVWEQDAEGRYTFISDGFLASTGLEPGLILGRTRAEIFPVEADPVDAAAFAACIEGRRPFRGFTFSWVTPSGARRWLTTSGEPIFGEDGEFRGYRGVGSDVTTTTLAKREVEHLAHYDSLTGLPNRAMLREVLDRAISRATRDGEQVAVAFLDLDGFKHINDNLGHALGDELLKTMATRLSENLRQGDLVARLGGDEFVVLVERPDGRPFLAAFASRLLDILSRPVRLDDRDYRVTGSVGLSVFPDDAKDAVSLLKNADAAMYVAKGHGKNNFQLYSADLAARAAELFVLEADLRGAIDHGDLRLHFQPKFCVKTGALTGMEALARWPHPTRGLVPPAQFITLAEERGLIVPIGRWVLRRVAATVRRWREAGHVVPRCAVNLSATHFAMDSIVDEVVAVLEAEHLDPTAIELEITESMLMHDPARTARLMQRLNALGVSVAIDDFGTGYSSLSYLKRFPARWLKIDRSFVRGLPFDADDAAITQAVVAMAHSLGMGVVAEGVETAAQLEHLRGLGCDEAQGYLLGRPVAEDEFEAMLLGRVAMVA